MESDIRNGQAVQTRVWNPQGREVTLDRPEFRVIMRDTIRDNTCALLVFMMLGHGG